VIDSKHNEYDAKDDFRKVPEGHESECVDDSQDDCICQVIANMDDEVNSCDNGPRNLRICQSLIENITNDLLVPQSPFFSHAAMAISRMESTRYQSKQV